MFNLHAFGVRRVVSTPPPDHKPNGPPTTLTYNTKTVRVPGDGAKARYFVSLFSAAEAAAACRAGLKDLRKMRLYRLFFGVEIYRHGLVFENKTHPDTQNQNHNSSK